MALTYGFYNSKNNDRLYDAIQMSSIFDGIILDGIFMSIGDRFNVTAGDGMTIRVGTGRAWFNHTWTLNDAIISLSLTRSEVLYDRIDAVILEVNAEEQTRANSIKIITGTPSSNAGYPTLINTNLIHQYPLAYIRVGAEVTEIRQANISNMVGSGSTPYVTGPLETINIEDMVAQWEDEWRVFFENQTDEMEATNQSWINQWNTWYTNYTTMNSAEFEAWRNTEKVVWNAWFDSIKDEFGDDAVGALLGKINDLDKETKTYIKVFSTPVDSKWIRAIRIEILKNWASSPLIFYINNYGTDSYGILTFTATSVNGTTPSVKDFHVINYDPSKIAIESASASNGNRIFNIYIYKEANQWFTITAVKIVDPNAKLSVSYPGDSIDSDLTNSTSTPHPTYGGHVLHSEYVNGKRPVILTEAQYNALSTTEKNRTDIIYYYY